MIVFNILLSILILYVTGTTLYLAIVTLAAYAFKKKTGVSELDINIAVVIPAHNEALQIHTTIKSVLDTRYSEKRRSIFVIADNCTDQTAEIAGNAGATVIERFDEEKRGKGQALDWFFQKQIGQYQDFDAIAIIDADTLCHPDFLSEISASLSHPEVKAVQGYYGVSNPKDNWRTALSSAALNVFHHVRPAGRNRINASAGLKGNGMAFNTDILKTYGWPAYSIVEDIEFSMLLLKNDILVHYNPDAIVFGEMATDKKQAETQRKRWEGGRFQILRKYASQFIGLWISRRRVRYLDGFLELVTPPLSLLVMGQVLAFAISAFLYPQFLFPSSCLIAGTVFYVFSGLILKRAPLYVWCCLLSAPFFILWKIPIYLKIVKKRDENVWERTKRQAELTPMGTPKKSKSLH